MLGPVYKHEDPRGNLEKASKYELWQLAKKLGFSDITYEMPQPLQAKMLRERGITNIDIPERILGDSRPTVYNTDHIAQAPEKTEGKSSMSADELLEAQYRHEMASKDTDTSKTPAQMSMTELRSECKRRGIKMARTDNLNTLREKLGQNAA